VYSDNNYHLTLINCTLVGNQATNLGGALSVFSGDNTKVINCTFSGNGAREAGGAIAVDDDIAIWNSTFTGNTADSDGNASRIRQARDVGGSIQLRNPARAGPRSNSVAHRCRSGAVRQYRTLPHCDAGPYEQQRRIEQAGELSSVEGLGG
jgi:predicted outer membrane repeat protein